MGIKYLGKFLRDKCGGFQPPSNLQSLKGKVIVVDVSIYLYKYAIISRLMESMYIMISTFLKYGIIPVFVFDGKPPKEKKDTLKTRREKRRQAWERYDELVRIMEDEEDKSDENRKQELQLEIAMVKKKTVTIKPDEISQVKGLLDAFGVKYLEAPGEADTLCAYLVHIGAAYACMSDDMDMFAYGCPRILRFVNIHKSTGEMYHLEEILAKLGLSLVEFRRLCILSGTDYNGAVGTAAAATEGYADGTADDTANEFEVMDKNNNINCYGDDDEKRRWMQNGSMIYTIYDQIIEEKTSGILNEEVDDSQSQNNFEENFEEENSVKEECIEADADDDNASDDDKSTASTKYRKIYTMFDIMTNTEEYHPALIPYKDLQMEIVRPPDIHEVEKIMKPNHFYF